MKQNQRYPFLFCFNTFRSNEVLKLFKSLASFLCSGFKIMPPKIIIYNYLNENNSKTKDHSSISSHSSIFLTYGANLMGCSVLFPSLFSMQVNDAWRKNRNRNWVKLHLSRPIFYSDQGCNGDTWFYHWVLFSILLLTTWQL